MAKKLDPENPNPGQPLNSKELQKRGVDPNYDGYKAIYNVDEQGNPLPTEPNPQLPIEPE